MVVIVVMVLVVMIVVVTVAELGVEFTKMCTDAATIVNIFCAAAANYHQVHPAH